MCRFVIYKGPPITLDLLTTRPSHSLIHQSFKSRQRKEPLNGDGFGIAWYVPELSETPALFRSVQPAWNNVNLRHLARVSQSSMILAHVRAATGDSAVNEVNCHPFCAGPFSFMHNGSVAEFQRLKRKLREGLSDDSYSQISGTTDSEHLFALFRDYVGSSKAAERLDAMADAMRSTIGDVERRTRDVGATRRSFLNMVVSDGERVVVSRRATDDAQAPSLWLRTGGQYVFRDDNCLMLEGDGKAVIVASEPLSEESGWEEVPPDHLLLVDAESRVSLQPIS